MPVRSCGSGLKFLLRSAQILAWVVFPTVTLLAPYQVRGESAANIHADDVASFGKTASAVLIAQSSGTPKFDWATDAVVIADSPQTVTILVDGIDISFFKVAVSGFRDLFIGPYEDRDANYLRGSPIAKIFSAGEVKEVLWNGDMADNTNVSKAIDDLEFVLMKASRECGTKINVVAHSLGTVIAYIALLDLKFKTGFKDNHGKCTYQGIDNFITLASPLSRWPSVLRRKLSERGYASSEVTIRTPRDLHIQRWINAYAQGDIVASSIDAEGINNLPEIKKIVIPSTTANSTSAAAIGGGAHALPYKDQDTITRIADLLSDSGATQAVLAVSITSLELSPETRPGRTGCNGRLTLTNGTKQAQSGNLTVQGRDQAGKPSNLQAWISGLEPGARKAFDSFFLGNPVCDEIMTVTVLTSQTFMSPGPLDPNPPQIVRAAIRTTVSLPRQPVVVPSINPPAGAFYLGDDTVTDPSTGLIWMRCAMGQSWTGSACSGTASSNTWDQAIALTGTVTFAGKNDWRLPNVRELETIVPWSTAYTSFKTTFPNMPRSGFWSSSSDASNWTSAWAVGFAANDGAVGIGGKLFGSGADAVRLVRGGQSSALLSVARPTSDYVDHGDGTVTHTPTGLMWKRCAEGTEWWAGGDCTGTAGSYRWGAAVLLTSTFAGENDWRLPTEEELLTLVDYTRTAPPAINTTMFPSTPSSSFWSSTSHSYSNPNQDIAWYVNFESGSARNERLGYGYHVRLVRGGRTLKRIAE